MNLQRIKTLAESKHIEFKSLAKEIKMSEGNLHRCVRENKIQATDLEKIAKILNVNISYFFDEGNKTEHRTAGRDYVEKGKIEHHGTEINAPVTTVNSDLEKENTELKRKLIAAQEKIIELMEKNN